MEIDCELNLLRIVMLAMFEVSPIAVSLTLSCLADKDVMVIKRRTTPGKLFAT